MDFSPSFVISTGQFRNVITGVLIIMEFYLSGEAKLLIVLDCCSSTVSFIETGFDSVFHLLLQPSLVVLPASFMDLVLLGLGLTG